MVKNRARAINLHSHGQSHLKLLMRKVELRLKNYKKFVVKWTISIISPKSINFCMSYLHDFRYIWQRKFTQIKEGSKYMIPYFFLILLDQRNI
jgi:hypothetical protein